MKKIISAILAAILCMGMLAGCGSVNKEEHPLGVFKGDKLVAEIGMPREQVEKNLGEGEDESDGKRVIYDGIEIYYRDDKVMLITFRGEEYSNYLGEAPGDKYENFGEYDMDTNYYDKDINLLMEDELKGNNNAEYVISYGKKNGTDDIIETIGIADFQAFTRGE